MTVTLSPPAKFVRCGETAPQYEVRDDQHTAQERFSSEHTAIRLAEDLTGLSGGKRFFYVVKVTMVGWTETQPE